MKDLITTIASILIFSLFLMQYIANIRTYSYIMDIESNLRIISLEGKETYNSCEKIEECLRENLDWNNGDTIVNKIDSDHAYENYEVRIEIPNAVTKMGGIVEEDSFVYRTKCVIKKKENTDEEFDNNDRDSATIDAS